VELIPPIQRNKQGNRTFHDKDIEVLNLIRCFRNLGMSIEDIRLNISTINMEYEQLNTKAILVKHKERLEQQITILHSFIDEIDNKINR
jgi:DNA-binding transcriptional MerR regulator